MQSENKTSLAIMRLLEPHLCDDCRFAALATVEMADGSSRRLRHCTRLACDNWHFEETDRPLTILCSEREEE